MLKRYLMIPFGTSTIGNFYSWYYFFKNTSSNFFAIEIWSVDFYLEETIIEFSNSFSLIKYYYWIFFFFFFFIMNKFLFFFFFFLFFYFLFFFFFFLNLGWINSFIFSIGPWVYITDKNQPCVVNRCSITARTLMKYLFHTELLITNDKNETNIN